MICTIKRFYTPADTTIQAINSDTLYSFIGMDVRDRSSTACLTKGRCKGLPVEALHAAAGLVQQDLEPEIASW